MWVSFAHLSQLSCSNNSFLDVSGKRAYDQMREVVQKRIELGVITEDEGRMLENSRFQIVKYITFSAGASAPYVLTFLIFLLIVLAPGVHYHKSRSGR
jgi:hypothetical protein